MSGGFFIIISKASSTPLKSGISISTVVSGISSLISLTHSLKIEAPPSCNSSLFTEVMTTCLRFNSFTESATLPGSLVSSSDGRPTLILQKPQLRVHVSPRIIKVAVLAFQHSAMLGHFASSQTV